MKPSHNTRRHVTRIAVERGQNEITVVIYGDGVLSYRSFSAGSHQLGLDLPFVVTPLSFRVLPVDHLLLKEIRIRPQRESLRLVLVLSRPVRYAVKGRGHVLAVRLQGR